MGGTIKLAITYSITKNLGAVAEHREKHSVLKKDGVLGTDRAMSKEIDLGGKVVVMDWKTKEEMFSNSIGSAMGISFADGKFYIASRKDNKIYVTNPSLEIERTIANRNFNDLHSLVRTNSGIMLTSSGIDAIIEVDLNGRSIWEWWAVDSGFDSDQMGAKRTIDKTADHSATRYPTLMQTTHVNSAIYADAAEQQVLATLFHHGKVIMVDRKTGMADTVLEGLNRPHGVYRYQDKFMISDTNNNRLIIFRLDGTIVKEISGEFNWIQDARPLANGNFMIADSNNSRILEIGQDGKVVDSFSHDPGHKIYNVMALP